MLYQDDFLWFLATEGFGRIMFLLRSLFHETCKKKKKKKATKKFNRNFECFHICAATFERVCFYLNFGCAYSLVHSPDNAAISGENVQFQCTVLLNVINRHFLPC